MSSLNKVFLMGNLTRDPDLKYTQSGTAICNLGLAVNRKYTSRTGEEVEEVCFVDIEVFGRQAESCKNYLQRGAPVLIEGRLRLDSWEDRNTGEKRSRLRVVGERVQFIGPPSRGSSFNDGAQQTRQYQSPGGQGQQPQQNAAGRPMQQQRQQTAPMPDFDTSGLESTNNGGGSGGDLAVDDDVPDQIPF